MSSVIVLKCGGSSIETLSDSFFTNIVTLQKAGYKPVIVHGGGPAIKDMLQMLQIESEFIDGLRKTTAPVMDVVEMVLTGSVNNAIIRKLNKTGIKSIGLSGSDDHLLTAEAKNFQKLGYVGDVTSVNTSLLEHLLDIDVVPVIAPIALDVDGNRYNVNADTAAGAVAKALGAKQLIFVTDVPGIMKENELIESVTDSEINKLIHTGAIYGGMIPKVEAAIASLSEDLEEAMIIDGNQSVLKNTNGTLIGTVIKKATVGVV